MPIPSTITDIFDTAALNSPAGTDQVAGTIDDYLRAIQAILKKQWITGGSIAAAATLPVPAAGMFLDVTGTATIQQIANSFDGRAVILRFAAGSTLQHSAALIMPGAANITTQANDAGLFVQTAAGTWTCAGFSRTLNADMVDGYHAGNASGQVAVSNGTLCTNLNADLLDGLHAAQISAWSAITGTPTTLSGYGITNGVNKAGDTMTGDLTISRTATPTSGAVYLGNSAARYLAYDGSSYLLPGAALYVNGVQAVTNSGTWGISITGNAATATNATSATSATSATTADKLSGSTGSAPHYSCRAWVDFNGAGSIGANQTINASGNVSSVYKNATGDYTINFTTALPAASFAVSGTGDQNGTLGIVPIVVSKSSASVRVKYMSYDAVRDVTLGSLAVFG